MGRSLGIGMAKSAIQHLHALAPIVGAGALYFAANAERDDGSSRRPDNAPSTTGTKKPRRYLLHLDVFPLRQTCMGRAIARKEVFRIDSDQLAVQNGLIDAADRAAELVRRCLPRGRLLARLALLPLYSLFELRWLPLRLWRSLMLGFLLRQQLPGLLFFLRLDLLLLGPFLRLPLRAVDARSADVVVFDRHAAHHLQTLRSTRLGNLIARRLLAAGDAGRNDQAADEQNSPTPATRVPGVGDRSLHHRSDSRCGSLADPARSPPSCARTAGVP